MKVYKVTTENVSHVSSDHVKSVHIVVHLLLTYYNLLFEVLELIWTLMKLKLKLYKAIIISNICVNGKSFNCLLKLHFRFPYNQCLTIQFHSIFLFMSHLSVIYYFVQ